MTAIVQRFLVTSVLASVYRQTVVCSRNQSAHHQLNRFALKNRQSKWFAVWSQNIARSQPKSRTMSNTSESTATAGDKPKIVFVLGAPGSGKGTQCSNIVTEYNYVHLSAGDLLRAERNRPGSELAQTIEEHIRAGQIIPVAVTCSLIERAMNEQMQVSYGGGDIVGLECFTRKNERKLDR